ncbi:MAG: rRNA pseudouridine synthase [Proteobacteria bacterium]|nr:rRNA pseudouridine synthase [Pseudomonadota bacterium]
MHRQRGEPERLQKVLARAGLASRREAEDWIRAGRLTVNGQAASLGVRVVPEDEVRLDGRIVRQRAPQSGGRVYLYHRSPGESLDKTPADAPEAVPLLSRLPKRGGRRFIMVSPMPRIDGGLELLCGDGELAARLQRSVRSLSSELSVRARGELTPQQIEGVLGGILDSGEKLTVLGCVGAGGEGTNRWYAITARGASGKDVRQLFERQAAIVSRVLRTRLGPLALERSLARGHFRELTREELQGLLSEASESQSPGAPEPLPQPRVETIHGAGRPAKPQGRSSTAKAGPKGSAQDAPGKRRRGTSGRFKDDSPQPEIPGRRRARGAPRAPVRGRRARD